ncbi:ParA family protein [Anaerospora hongkongensis]|uniref:ParA family protein n=1 Tax=Anaerospora hongkongensis TaxID=244830 RepID=UPI00289F16E4|nr:ParA family protein [Anaerospora hongkongensis]
MAARTKERNAKIISFGIQKGGVGKTTTSSIITYLIGEKMKKKILLVDVDSQGNSTFFLTRRSIYDFENRTTLEMISGYLDPHECIVEVTKNVHVIPAEDRLSDLEEFVYVEWRDNNKYLFDNFAHLNMLKQRLEPLRKEYDYIILDLPPSTGLATRMGLVASDYAVVLMSCDMLCYEAVKRYFGFQRGIVSRGFNPDLRILGILPSLINSRYGINQGFLQKANEEYDALVFDALIQSKVKIQEFAAEGISMKRKDEREALEQYEEVLKEVLMRVDIYEQAKAKQ